MTTQTREDVLIEQPSEQRNQYLIKPRFQHSMMLETLLVSFILVNSIVIFGYFLLETTSDLQSFRQYLAYSIASIEVLAFIVIYFVNRRLSHRIAGPVYKIEGILSSLAQGDFRVKMSLREKDHFQELSEQVNTLVGTLREPLDESQQLAREIQITVMEGKAVSQESIDELVRRLEFFKVSGSSEPASATAVSATASAGTTGPREGEQ